jgi:hypothetical protein
MRTIITAMVLTLCAISAGPASKPTSKPAQKTKYTLMHGAVRFLIPAEWKQTVHSDDDQHTQFQSPDGKCLIVVGVHPEDMGFPSHNESMIEQMKLSVIRGMKKRLQERGVQMLYGPRSETDTDFVLRIHTRYVDDKQTFDEMQTYRADGLDLFNVLTQAKTDNPAEAKSLFEVGDDVALSMILGPADKKQPTSKPTP